MDKKSKKWKLSNEGINDEQAFISRTRFLSGYDGRDFLNENVPNELFTSVSDAIRYKRRASLSAIFLSTLCMGGVVLFAIKALSQARVDPLFGSALCFLGAVIATKYRLNHQESNFEFDINEVEKPPPSTPEPRARIFARARRLKKLNTPIYVKKSNQNFYKLESFDWDMPNAYVFILGHDTHRVSLGLNGHISGELYFKKGDVLSIVEEEKGLFNELLNGTKNQEGQVQQLNTKRNRKRHCPHMLLVCCKKEYLDAFIALGLTRSDLSPQQKIYFDLLVFIHTNWARWESYRDGNRESAHNKQFRTELEIPLNVMGDKNVTRLRDVSSMSWRYLEEWLEELNFIDVEELPQKGDSPKANS